jgi:hypothetical protein
MIKRYCAFAFLMLLIIDSKAQFPKTLLTDGMHLLQLKQKAAQKDKASLLLIAKLKKKADGFLMMKPASVMDKNMTPASGSKHDYMSQAPYFWYDSTKFNGLPYIRRDGERNPEIYRIRDKANLDSLENSSRILALAWYFTGEEKYAAKAASLLSYWFFTEDSKMNPNLDYAQAIPGLNNGRGIGIIESRALTGIADAAALLQHATSWKEADTKALQQWYHQFLEWMLTSKNGREEHAAKNNHGTWYYVQAIDFALFTGDTIKAAQLSEESRKLLDSQLTTEGKQPLELERTKAMSYSSMNLSGWFYAARLAAHTGTDLWNYTTSKGATLRTALDWLIPYATGEKKWNYRQIEKYNRGELYPLLLQAGDIYDATYLLIAERMAEGTDKWMMDLLYRK